MQEKGGNEFFVFLFYLTISYLLTVLVCSQPTPGYFTDDQTLDFLLQIQDGVGMKKVKPGDSNQSKHINLVSSTVLGTVRNKKNLKYGPFLPRTQSLAEWIKQILKSIALGAFLTNLLPAQDTFIWILCYSWAVGIF